MKNTRIFQNKQLILRMEISDLQIQSNALLQAEDLLSNWTIYCCPQLINKVIWDLNHFNYPVEKVDGLVSYWDVTSYLVNDHTECSLEEKIKAIYTFSFVNSVVLIGGEKYVGSANVIAALIRSKYPVSDELYDRLIDFGYRISHGENLIME